MAENIAIEAFNGTRSTIIDQINQAFQSPSTADAVLIIGTSRKGPIRQLIKASDDTVEEIFGSVPSDPSFEINGPKAYYEARSVTGNGLDAFIYRVGDAQRSILNLYESQGGSNINFGKEGDLSFTPDTPNNALNWALLNTAKIEGPDANAGRIEVFDESGVPKAISFTTPDEVTKVFALDPFGTQPGALYNVRDIAVAFNSDPDWSKWYVTNYPVLRQIDLPVTVQEDPVTKARFIEVEETIGSWGDKLETLERVSINNPSVVAEIPQGRTSFVLRLQPIKDTSGLTSTITTFRRTLRDETAFTVTAVDVGSSEKSVQLFLGRPSSNWDGNIGFVYETNSSNANFNNFILNVIKPNGNKLVVPKSEYTVDSAGILHINLTSGAFQLGDIYAPTYKYQAFFRETNLRSQLEPGNEFSYFVKGSEIIFGAGLSLPTEAVYASRQPFSASDINILDSNSIRIGFINPSTRPAIGSQVLITYTYLPELPASSGASLVLPNGSVTLQRSGFSGGDDGRLPGKLRYKQLVEEALDIVELYPFRRIIIAGAYVDDIVDGFDDETGLPAIIAVDWASSIVPKINRRSNLVKECTWEFAVRPPIEYTPEAINRWFDRCLNNDDTEPGRPANMMDALSNIPGAFRVNVVAGAPFMALGQILGGANYVAYPATLYAGIKQDLPVEMSATNMILPGAVSDLGIKVLNAARIGGMNNKKYTFMTVNSAGAFIVADAPTLAQRGSHYDRQFVVDAVFIAIDVVRRTAERYIGQPRLPEVLEAMKNKAQRNLAYLVPKVFLDARVEVMEVPDGSITGRTKLGLSLITAREIRRVDVETRISLV